MKECLWDMMDRENQECKNQARRATAATTTAPAAPVQATSARPAAAMYLMEHV